jgi:5-methylcytosine-specific restriction protein A
MPRKPKRPCSYPGCPELTDERFCATHKKRTDAEYNKYGRDPEAKRLYGKLWRKVRAQKLADSPLCEVCLREGCTTPAEEVHHRIQLRKGGTHDPGNLMSLCVSCHSRITAREGGRWG